MAKLIPLANYRQKPAFVFFNRVEINLLLAVYSRKVAKGEWGDYSMESGAGLASFTVFRSTFEPPLYTVSKNCGAKNRSGQHWEYRVLEGDTPLSRASCLKEALTVFDPPMPRLVRQD